MSKNKKNKSFSLKKKLDSTNMNNDWYDFFFDCFLYLLVIFITALISCNLIFLIHIPKEIVLPIDVCRFPYTDEKRYGGTGTSPIYNLAEHTEISNEGDFDVCAVPKYSTSGEADNYLKTMYDKLKYKNQSLFYSFLQNLYRGGHAFRNYLDGTQNIPLQHTAWHMRAFMMVHRNFRKYLGAIFDMLYSFSDPGSYCKTVLFMVTFVLVFLIHFAGIGWLLLGGTYVFAIILYCAEMAFGGAPGVFGLGLTPFGGFGTFIFGLAVCASVSVSGLWLYYKCLLVAQSRKVIFCLLRNNGCIITILFGMAIVYSAFQHLNKFSAMTMLVLFLIMGFKTLKMHFNNCKDLGKGYVCDSEKFFNSVQNLRSYNE